MTLQELHKAIGEGKKITRRDMGECYYVLENNKWNFYDYYKRKYEAIPNLSLEDWELYEEPEDFRRVLIETLGEASDLLRNSCWHASVLELDKLIQLRIKEAKLK